jgi:hypothetical protein
MSFQSPDAARTQLVRSSKASNSAPEANILCTDDDAAELACICRAPNAATLIPTCEACVAEFDQDDTDADDVSVDENGSSHLHTI